MRDIPKPSLLLAGLITARISILAVAILCVLSAIDRRSLGASFWWATALFALATALMFAQQALPALLRTGAERGWRRGLARANLSLDEKHRPEDATIVQAATQSAEKAATYTVSYLGPLCAAACAPVAVLAIIGFGLSWPIAGILALSTLFVPVLVCWAIRSLKGAGAGYGRASGKLAASFLTGIRTLRSALILNATAQRRDQIAGFAEDMRTSVMRLLYRNQVMILVTDGAFGVATMTVAAGCGLYQVQRGDWTPTQALTLVLLAALIIEPVNDMGRTFYTGASGKAALGAIERILANFPSECGPQEPPGQGPGGGSRGEAALSLEVDHLTVTRAGNVVVEDVSFQVPAGGHLMLLGPSGSGKSSLLLALAGLIPTAGGTVKIADAATSPAELRARTHYVPQSPTLFNGTIASNVDLAERGAGENEVRAALSRAAFDADPSRPVGEHRGLSGGEIARLSLARGFLAGAPVLLLDESTANLDRATAARARAAALSSGATVIEVTHRLEESREAEQVLTLTGGRLVDTQEFLSHDTEHPESLAPGQAAQIPERPHNTETPEARR